MHNFITISWCLPRSYSSTRLQSLDNKTGLSAATIARRERMRASQEAKIASKSMLGKLERHTKFDQLELRRLRKVWHEQFHKCFYARCEAGCIALSRDSTHQVFASVAGDAGEFTRVQFVRVMSQEYPALRGDAFAKTANLSSVPDHVILRENPQLCMLFDA